MRPPSTPTPGTSWSTATAARPWTCTTSSTADGGRITQWTRNNANQQQWQFVDSGGGYYRLKSRLSGKVLDVYNFSTANGGADRAMGRHQRHQPAVAARRQPRRLCTADQPPQQQGPRGPGRLHRRRRQHRPVRRLGRHQPAMAARPGRRPTTPRTAAVRATLPSTYRWTSTGPLANPKSGWVSLKDFTVAPYNGRHLVYADHARHRIDVGLDELRPLHQLVRHGLGQPERDVRPPPSRPRCSTSPRGTSGCSPTSGAAPPSPTGPPATPPTRTAGHRSRRSSPEASPAPEQDPSTRPSSVTARTCTCSSPGTTARSTGPACPSGTSRAVSARPRR